MTPPHDPIDWTTRDRPLGQPAAPLTPTMPPSHRPRRRSYLPLYVAMAGVALAAVGTAGAALTAGRHAPAPKPPAAAPASIPPPPSDAVVDERTECVLLIPLMQQALDIVTAHQKHPLEPPAQTADQLTTLIDKLNTAELVAPADMKADVDTQVTVLMDLRQMVLSHGYGSLRTEAFGESGVRLLERCKRYATG